MAGRDAPDARMGNQDRTGKKVERVVGAPRTSPVETCPLCGAEGAVQLFTGPDRLHDTNGIFSYVKCVLCKTIYQNPRVVDEDLALCYPTGYYTHAGRKRRSSSTPIPRRGL